MSDRTTARVVGILFIVASVTAILGGSLIQPITESGGALDVATGGDAPVVAGILLELVLVASVGGIAALLFPVLRRVHEGMAMGYVVARTLEAGVLLAASLAALVSVASVRGLPESDLADISAFDVSLAVREQAYLVGSLVMLGVGGLLLYALLYRGRLVPVWLSLWGLAGAALILLRGLLEMGGVNLDVAVQAALAAPIGLQEMVLAVWLIVRGFRAIPVPAAPGSSSGTPAGAGATTRAGG
ncbi:MAG: DUF4386 domain-containing protein [Candidatus Nanopelagicales bacterium]